MTRRDMIIVAVLVNAALLAILFMMAINSDDDSITSTPESQPIAEVSVIDTSIAQEITVTPGTPVEESDNTLKDFPNTNNPQLPVIPEEGTQDLPQDVHPQQPEDVKPETNVPEPHPEKDPKKLVTITVKKGDSLDKIAKANGTTVKAIKTENQLKTDKLDIGQVLRVPVGSKKSKAEKVAKTEKPAKESKDSKLVASSDTEYYTIKNGDNPWKIAKKFNIKVSEFLKLNDLDEEKARNLKVGEKVRVK